MPNFSVLDQLLETYKALMPKTVYLVKNKKRYDEAVKAICEIASCAVEADSDAKVKISPDPLTYQFQGEDVDIKLYGFMDKVPVGIYEDFVIDFGAFEL